MAAATRLARVLKKRDCSTTAADCPLCPKATQMDHRARSELGPLSDSCTAKESRRPRIASTAGVHGGEVAYVVPLSKDIILK